MGMFDRRTGTKRPVPGAQVRSMNEVHDALLAVNDPGVPYVVRDGSAEGVDLVAEWRIVDADWYTFFAKAGLTRVFKVLLRYVPDQHEVRSVDEEWQVTWRAGVPELSRSAEKSRGQKREVSFRKTFAFNEQGEYGEVANYKFATGELKNPLQDAVTKCGWTWRAVSFGKL